MEAISGTDRGTESLPCNEHGKAIAFSVSFTGYNLVWFVRV